MELELINLIQQNYPEEITHDIIVLRKKDCDVREKQITDGFDKKEKWVSETWMVEKTME